MKINVTIQGTAPLLMNRFTGEAEAETSSGGSPAFRDNGKGTPREQAEKTAYRDPTTGELYLPGRNIFAAIVEAGRFLKIGHDRVTTERSSLVPAGLRVEETEIPLGTRDFEVDSRRVRIPSTGQCVMRHRARLNHWKATFTLDVDESVFGAGFVRVLVDDAGRKIGVGGYRPATRGPFGRFVVTGWEVAHA